MVKNIYADSEILTLSLKLFNRVLEDNRHRDKEIQQGIEGERKHAQEVLGWIKKLRRKPPLPLKIAALFHDIDRVVTPGVGSGFSGDRKSKEYFLHKKAHAKRSADYICQKLEDVGIGKNIISKTRFLIEHHDDTLEEVESYKDRDLEILVAADTFSWFSTTGVKLLKVEGKDRALDKLRFMLGKTPKFALKLLSRVKIKEPVLEDLKNLVLKEINK